MTTERVRLERPARMTHVAVRAPDVDAAVDFYERYAGLRITHDRTDQGVRVVWLADTDAPEFVVVVIQLEHETLREPAPTDHFGFDVASREDVDRIAALAKAEGTHKLGPVEAGPIVGYFVMVRDPSGNTCEFSFGQNVRSPETPPPASSPSSPTEAGS